MMASIDGDRCALRSNDLLSNGLIVNEGIVRVPQHVSRWRVELPTKRMTGACSEVCRFTCASLVCQSRCGLTTSGDGVAVLLETPRRDPPDATMFGRVRVRPASAATRVDRCGRGCESDELRYPCVAPGCVGLCDGSNRP